MKSLRLRASYLQSSNYFGSFSGVYLDVSKTFGKLTISLSSSTSLLGFSVAVKGMLSRWDNVPLEGQNVLLAFNVPGGIDWTTIASARTQANGNYSATWIPQATGSFTLRASWAGNSLHRWTSSSTTLSSTIEGENVFSVVSNSTVSVLSFDAVTRSLRFNIQGSPGTLGSADVLLPKALAPDPGGVAVYLNGTRTQVQYTSLGESVIIHFSIVFHSSYSVKVNLTDNSPLHNNVIASTELPLILGLLTAGLIAAT